MGFVIINKELSSYVEIDAISSKYFITHDINKCHHFKRRKCAQNFLKADTQHILKQKGWEVIHESYLNDTIELKEENSSLVDLNHLKNFKQFEPNAELSKSFEVPNIDILNTIKQFEIFLHKMKDYADVLSKQHSYIECCKVDYEHKMEFSTKDLNVLKRAELETNYSSCLEERRRIKDDMVILERLLNASISDLIDGSLDKFLSNLENRSYRPRVAPELFEGKEIVQVKPKFKLDTTERDSLTHNMEELNNRVSCLSSSYLELISGFEPIPDCGE